VDGADHDTTDDRLDGDEVFCPTCNVSFSPVLDTCPDDGTRLIRWHRDPMIGAVLDGRFRIVEPLGTGGMGSVYRGIHLSVDRPVAIKVIRNQLGHDRAAAKRFLREAKLLMGFSHPNIVEVFDFGQAANGALYLVMEMLSGETLADALARNGRFAPRGACEVAMQLCDALVAAHARGVVHRDLKPANIVIADRPVRDLVKVLDFGLAKSLANDSVTWTSLTEVGAVLGTPLYMAPEAIAGAGADPRSDLYALGCIIYEMLAGAPPFVDPAVNVVLARHVTEPPPTLPADVPAALGELVDDLLAKAPELRPASAAAVRARLEIYLAGDEASDLDDAETLIRTPALPAVPAPARPTVRGIAPPPERTVIVAPARRLPIVVIAISAVIIAIAWCLAIAYRSAP